MNWKLLMCVAILEFIVIILFVVSGLVLYSARKTNDVSPNTPLPIIEKSL